jgi:hypothetical protein
MYPHLETYAMAQTIERPLTLKRAEQHAHHRIAIQSTLAIPSEPHPAQTRVRWDRLRRTVQSLRWALRPSHS